MKSHLLILFLIFCNACISQNGEIERVDWVIFRDSVMLAKGQNYSSTIPEITIKKHDEFEVLKLNLNYNFDSINKMINRRLICYCIDDDKKIDFTIKSSGMSNLSMRIEKRLLDKWAKKCKNKMLLIYSDDKYQNGLGFKVILK